jgi:hypothetical protein
MYLCRSALSSNVLWDQPLSRNPSVRSLFALQTAHPGRFTLYFECSITNCFSVPDHYYVASHYPDYVALCYVSCGRYPTCLVSKSRNRVQCSVLLWKLVSYSTLIANSICGQISALLLLGFGAKVTYYDPTILDLTRISLDPWQRAISPDSLVIMTNSVITNFRAV